MLTPIDVHYVVGKLASISADETIEVVLGDLVTDATVGENRGVDVTLTFRAQTGEVTAFKRIEVNKRSRPLNITQVEQLCVKFNDMPRITHRSLV